MDQLQLFQLLRNDREELDVQIKAFEKAVSGALLNLAATLPDKGEIFSSLAREMGQTLTHITQRQLSVPIYFSGQGPTAKKLREHLLIMEWFASQFDAQRRGPNEIHEFLHQKLKMFDFHPITDVAANNEVNAFLTSCVARVRTSFFSSPLPAIPATISTLDELQTGIFGEPGLGETLSLVLRVGKADLHEFQAVFVAIPNKNPALYYFHPWEGSWLSPSNWDVTFPGLRRQFEAEFEIALSRALGDMRSFDWKRTLGELNEVADSVFDKEELLPPLIKMGANGETAYLSYDNVRSEIYANVGGMMLVFINTRGQFPHRTGAKLMTTLDGTNGLCSVDESKVPVELRLGLAHKARVILSALKGQIDVAIAENRPLQPRAEPIAPTEGHRPEVLN